MATGDTVAGPTRLRFGEMTLDLSSGELIRGGVRVRLQDHSFRILQLLTARPGEMVDRESLIAHLWPRTTYIDTDAGLNTAVKKLRAALGDDADSPRYIETLPRRGYRFIAAISIDDDLPGPERATDGPARHAGRASQAWRRRVLGGALVVLLAGLLVAVGSRLLPGTTAGRAGPASAVAALPDRNVAVLPFTNLTGDPAREHLALALAESLLHRLADVRDINVIARTSSFAFQGRYGDVREIGRQLDARYLVEGSLQDSSTRLRVTTQLIDATTGAHIWSKTFDRPRDDFFKAQDEIALEVAGALQLSVGRLAIGALRPIGTSNFDAWLAYEQGRALRPTRRTEDLHAAVEFLERSTRLDPAFAAARIELANAYLDEANFAAPRDVSPAVATQRVVARAAPLLDPVLRQDPDNGAALIVRGRVAHVAGDLASAEADLRRGIELSPNDARGYQSLAELLIDGRGRLEEGLAAVARARLLDPLEPRGPYYAGLVEFFRGDTPAGERLMIETLRLRPDYAPALVRLGWGSWKRGGRFAEAINHGEQALRIDPHSLWVRDMMAPWYLELGEIEAARSLYPAGAPEATTAIAIPFRQRQYARAGEHLFAHPAQFDSCDMPDVVLEYARATGDFARARQFLDGQVALWNGRGEARIEPENEPAAVVMAWLLGHSGDGRRARRLLEALLARRDAAAPSVPGPCSSWNVSPARALGELGRDRDALAGLRRATLELQSWAYGWYIFDRDPFFDRLRDHPEFQSLRNAYRERVAAEQARLEDLRVRGLVPRRAAPVAAGRQRQYNGQ